MGSKLGLLLLVFYGQGWLWASCRRGAGSGRLDEPADVSAARRNGLRGSRNLH